MLKLPSRRDEKLGRRKSDALVETKRALRKMAHRPHQIEADGIALPAVNYQRKCAPLPHQMHISSSNEFWGAPRKARHKYQPRDIFPEMPPRARETLTFDAMQFLPALENAGKIFFMKNTYFSRGS